MLFVLVLFFYIFVRVIVIRSVLTSQQTKIIFFITFLVRVSSQFPERSTSPIDENGVFYLNAYIIQTIPGGSSVIYCILVLRVWTIPGGRTTRRITLFLKLTIPGGSSIFKISTSKKPTDNSRREILGNSTYLR